ncbi:hypothetical protein L1987_75985 [Smallanthus sonchifolius]|uniref:Uncharacterized protein n=1 Tax=Smallanthus sonchifolius TaxID=185202 RepID=A0ACB9A7Z0_9ASTR|nr:hypothetical protein L1987_75985 [Smallanthus sonchifolius]
MADTPRYFPSISGSKSDKCVNFPSGFHSNENRGKQSFIDTSLHLQGGSSLSLGLGGGGGCSVSSGVTLFSGKEIEEHSSGNLDLSMNLHTGTEVDLELSLASGSVGSDVTRSSFPFRVTSSATTSAGFQIVDEGSTSSRWKFPLLPPLQTTAAAPITPFVVYRGGEPRRRNGNVKNCQFIGCVRGARGASGFCIGHGGGRRCQREGCQKGAEGKTVFCKAHGGGRRCEFLGCTKSAEGRTDYCIGHGGGKRCTHPGCPHAARGKSGLCIRHGGGKRCKMEGCSKSAEDALGLCISHGGGRRCHYPACTKGAQGSTMFCKAHGGGKRCMFLGCTKGAEGSTSFCKGHGGGKRCTFEGGCSKSVHGGTLFCVNHGGGKRCAMAECTKSARGRTNFCVRHGGGKRCVHEGCGKSAQGRTDFCKAHGGGKRCSWVQPDPSVGQTLSHCDKFPRGKSGLCASHSQLVPDNQIPGLIPDHLRLMPTGSGGYEGRSVEMAGHGSYSLPEGRVHGGSLMAMLRGCPSGPSEPGETRTIAGTRWSMGVSKTSSPPPGLNLDIV